VRNERGFSLIELLVAMFIMLLISGAATTALLKMTSSQATLWNRTQMHSGIRGATEVLQQEVGQAGSIALPATVTTTSAVSVGTAQTVNVSSGLGMFPNEYLTIDAGALQETVQITSVSTSSSPHQVTATFAKSHGSGVPVAVFGSFEAGIVPPSTTNGSTGTVLKLFGDINGDGNMVYVEYSCDTTTNHNLYRNSMPFNQTTAKVAATASQILLSNVVANPNGTACFTYQTTTVPKADGTSVDYITNVAVTLTVQTQQLDAITKSYQTETKALLNVAPRNVVNAANVAALQEMTSRLQLTPQTVTNLLP
jgi:prepilin-type N-terminal cleavage/methylation domain-containing protein